MLKLVFLLKEEFIFEEVRLLTDISGKTSDNCLLSSFFFSNFNQTVNQENLQNSMEAS